MSELREAINQALKRSLKEKNKLATSTLRLIIAALKDRDIAARSKGRTEGIPDDEILQMLQTMVKQRRESIALYEQGGRLELAEQEREEIEVINSFLPQQMDESAMQEAVETLVEEMGATSLKEMGAVMGELRNRFPGRMDFGRAATIVKEQLS